MTKPDIAILTLCDQLGAELQAGLQPKCSVTIHDGSGALESTLRRGNVSGIIADFRNVSCGGHDEDRALTRWRDDNPSLPVIVIAAESCPETLQRHAACDEYTRFIQSADPVAILELLSQLTAADSVTDSPQTPADDDSVQPVAGDDTVLCGITRRFDTREPQMKEMLLDLQVAAQHDVTVLLIGETGSGKTFLSRLIHEVSPRRDKPFITVACGALPGELIESELFGHVKGSFTSAHADKEGKFLAAADGTILLDEIDALTPEQQVKLLRVIETGEFEPVGSNQTHQCRARLVVASNLDL
ncbi:MAG: sigma-54 factor interaction domain-containing protein, partial [Planctomycetes bacterium]|nr:sigma-54 factor interaction domain-containing protein [Planctomycetota bacterium]